MFSKDSDQRPYSFAKIIHYAVYLFVNNCCQWRRCLVLKCYPAVVFNADLLTLLKFLFNVYVLFKCRFALKTRYSTVSVTWLTFTWSMVSLLSQSTLSCSYSRRSHVAREKYSRCTRWCLLEWSVPSRAAVLSVADEPYLDVQTTRYVLVSAVGQVVMLRFWFSSFGLNVTGLTVIWSTFLSALAECWKTLTTEKLSMYFYIIPFAGLVNRIVCSTAVLSSARIKTKNWWVAIIIMVNINCQNLSWTSVGLGLHQSVVIFNRLDILS